MKSPKLYFYDTGLVSYLLQIESSNHLSIHSSRGALFESFVISEFLKQRFNKGLDSNLTYWRDNTGNEIDLIVEKGEQLIPFEIKSGHTLDTHWFSGLKRWQELAKKTAGSLHLVYGGDENRRQSDVIVSSWRSLATPAKNLASAS